MTLPACHVRDSVSECCPPSPLSAHCLPGCIIFSRFLLATHCLPGCMHLPPPPHPACRQVHDRPRLCHPPLTLAYVSGLDMATPPPPCRTLTHSLTHSLPPLPDFQCRQVLDHARPRLPDSALHFSSCDPPPDSALHFWMTDTPSPPRMPDDRA